MHISTLHLTTERAPVSGFALYIIMEESERLVRLLHPMTLSDFEISHSEFRLANEQELWPNPYDSNPRTMIRAGMPITFPEQIARYIEKAMASGKQYSAPVVRRALAGLRGVKLESVPLLKEPRNTASSSPRGFAVRTEKRPGVIEAITELLGREGGITFEEIVTELAKQFPDRPVPGMRTTVRCQLNRLPGKLGRPLDSHFDNQRGKVFQWKTTQ